MEESLLAARIGKFLVQQFPAAKNVGVEESLLNNGLIDSLGILDVVTFLEKELGISISDDELLPENFDSIRSLSHFVHQKTNGRVA